ncbi:MAG: hypothetical protein CL799_00655 [Chromatiales bacterium]|jgi:hypothetical protein|nr:hypothetical protein [Chromatiales bacterium]
MAMTESTLHADSTIQSGDLSPDELKYRLLMDNFATPEECRDMIALANKHGTTGGGFGVKASPANSPYEDYTGYGIRRTYTDAEYLKDHEVTLRVISRARDLLKQHFRVPFLWLDHAEIMLREPAVTGPEAEAEEFSMQLHFDNNGPTIWRRTHTGVLFLNDEFEGGRTAVTGKDANFGPYREIQPSTGRLVGFKVAETPHGVTKLHSGKRYIIAMWFSSHWNNVGRQIKVFHPSIANVIYKLLGK